jgi:hypothetical protein
MIGPSVVGLLLVMLTGILGGSFLAPIKRMRRYRYEQWAFVSNLLCLLVLPWAVALLVCPGALQAYAELPAESLLRANLLSACWGVANVLAGLCVVRIGFSLTVGLLTGIGMPIGVLTPLLLTGSGSFAGARFDLVHGGALILGGVGIILAAVVLVILAGFGRSRSGPTQGGGFATGLIMAALCGVLQVGLSFAFVYGQGPITAALQMHGSGDIQASIGVWPVTLIGGALVNIGYAAWRLTRTDGWPLLVSAPRDVALSLLIGVMFYLCLASMGTGMLLMGSLGASVGFGIYQALQVSTAQVIGFASGEWRGVHGLPRQQMYVALGLLLLAVGLFAAGKAMAT